MKVAIAQSNPTIGDFAGNLALAQEMCGWAREQGADLVVFPELFLCGYPPRDLLCVPEFLRDLEAAEQELASTYSDLGILLGTVVQEGVALYNAARLYDGSEIVGTQCKTLLPSYDVFDEARYFSPAQSNVPMMFRGMRLGVTVCEDIWFDSLTPRQRARYAADPLADYAAGDIDVLLNVAASPYVQNKGAQREEIVQRYAQRLQCPVVYCNQVGGNDQLIFDGQSLVADAQGAIVWRGGYCVADRACIDVLAMNAPPAVTTAHEPYEELALALQLGLRDYVHKCGFTNVLLGVSGGIDSAVVAALAVDALGADVVTGIAMPSQYSSAGSVTDARALCEALGMGYEEIAIAPMYEAMRDGIGHGSVDGMPDLAEENLQARIRGSILMTLSNRRGALVLTTGNKSEMAVGYCTLYGDMNGALAVLADVPKMAVYGLARWFNREQERIPVATIDKPPSAELRPGQVDASSLPPYEVLDEILELYIEEHLAHEAIVARGHDCSVVRRVIQLVHRNEYKRAQAAPGLKVSPRAFGMGRRFPIAARWQG